MNAGIFRTSHDFWQDSLLAGLIAAVTGGVPSTPMGMVTAGTVAHALQLGYRMIDTACMRSRSWLLPLTVNRSCTPTLSDEARSKRPWADICSKGSYD